MRALDVVGGVRGRWWGQAPWVNLNIWLKLKLNLISFLKLDCILVETLVNLYPFLDHPCVPPGRPQRCHKLLSLLPPVAPIHICCHALLSRWIAHLLAIQIGHAARMLRLGNLFKILRIQCNRMHQSLPVLA